MAMLSSSSNNRLQKKIQTDCCETTATPLLLLYVLLFHVMYSCVIYFLQGVLSGQPDFACAASSVGPLLSLCLQFHFSLALVNGFQRSWGTPQFLKAKHHFLSESACQFLFAQFPRISENFSIFGPLKRSTYPCDIPRTVPRQSLDIPRQTLDIPRHPSTTPRTRFPRSSNSLDIPRHPSTSLDVPRHPSTSLDIPRRRSTSPRITLPPPRKENNNFVPFPESSRK